MADFEINDEIFEDSEHNLYNTHGIIGEDSWGNHFIVCQQGTNNWIIVRGIREDENLNLPVFEVEWNNQHTINRAKKNNTPPIYKHNKFWIVTGPVDSLKTATAQLKIIVSTLS